MQLSHAPQVFRLMSTWFWALALIMGGINDAIGSRRSVPMLDAPARARRAAYLRRIAIGGHLPWLIIGAGQLLGSTPTVWSYFRPQDANPFVIDWLAGYFELAGVSAGWILLGLGAQKSSTYSEWTACAAVVRRGQCAGSAALPCSGW